MNGYKQRLNSPAPLVHTHAGAHANEIAVIIEVNDMFPAFRHYGCKCMNISSEMAKERQYGFA